MVNIIAECELFTSSPSTISHRVALGRENVSARDWLFQLFSECELQFLTDRIVNIVNKTLLRPNSCHEGFNSECEVKGIFKLVICNELLCGQYKIMAGRLFFVWWMFAASKSQDNRNYSAKFEAKARASFNPLLDLTEMQFKLRYRLSKTVFRFFCKELRRLTNLRSSQRVSLEHKVLTALFFFATGSYQRPVGVAKHMSQKMCSVYIEQVTQALTHKNILSKYIRFPDTPAARQAISQRFYIKYGMPGVVGCIDGSHFKIVVPQHEEEHSYYSRKHYHSLNVQMVCDDQYRILSVNPKFGGANHDSFIWENSDLNTYIQSLHQNGEVVWLLGDSGYPQRPWLMTPILDTTSGTPEYTYNEKHMRARVVIENTFSRLKNRWRCLHKDRVLHYKPLKCSRIILACSVLHNIIVNFGIDDAEELELGREERTGSVRGHHHYRESESISDLIRGRILRDQVVRRIQ